MAITFLFFVLLSSHVVAVAMQGAMTKALQPRQNVSTCCMPPNALNVTFWCKTIDTTDPAAILDLWEEKGVGYWLSKFTKATNDTGLGPDNWPLKIFKSIYPNAGNPDLGGCGVIGGGCHPQLDCEDMVKNGNGNGGPAYWSLQALIGMQNKINVAHEFLQDATLDNILMLDQISKDFTAPDNMAELVKIAELITSCCFMVGTVASSVGVGINAYLGAASRIGPIEAKIATIQGDLPRYGPKALKSAQDELADAQKKAARIPKLSPDAAKASALGSGIYLIGCSFSIISSGSPAGTGKVEPGDIAPTLKKLFDAARSSLSTIGLFAAGGGRGDYSTLPHQTGTGPPLPPDAYIAGFYSDGRMLLGESNPAFNQTIKAAFDYFTAKLVDQALQTAWYQVVAIMGYKNANDCTKSQNGHVWVVPEGTSGYCMALFRWNKGGAPPCPYKAPNCNYIPAGDDVYAKMQDKYRINLHDYYMAAYKCAIAKLDGNMPDVVNLPSDGSLPTCWWSIKAQKATIKGGCIGIGKCWMGSYHVDMKNF